MANQGSENPGQNPDNSPQESADIDAIFERFEKNERARKIKVFILAAIVLAGGLTVFFGSVLFRENRLTANIDIEAIDAKAAARINDPQCRDMIAQIDQLSARYFKLEPQLDEKLLGGTPGEINALRDEIARIQQRLDEISEFSLKANLRFDASRSELDEWFDYVALELNFVDRLGDEQLALLKKASADAPIADAPDSEEPKSDAQNSEEGVVVSKGQDKKKKTPDAPSRTPLERKQAALFALHDSFQNFRIWHTAGAHPCGAADEGETPWVPAEKDAP